MRRRLGPLIPLLYTLEQAHPDLIYPVAHNMALAGDSDMNDCPNI